MWCIFDKRQWCISYSAICLRKYQRTKILTTENTCHMMIHYDIKLLNVDEQKMTYDYSLLLLE